MRLPVLSFILVFIALVPWAGAQNAPRSFLAYVHVIQSDAAHRDGFDACVIVGTDGEYRYEIAPPADRPAAALTRVYLGHLPPAAFSEFKTLVQARELRGLSSSEPHGSLLASHSWETVSLRLHRPDETQEIVFTTVDGRNKMPPAIHAFIPWMEEFQKTLGKPDRRARPRDCSGLDASPDFAPQLQKR